MGGPVLSVFPLHLPKSWVVTEDRTEGALSATSHLPDAADRTSNGLKWSKVATYLSDERHWFAVRVESCALVQRDFERGQWNRCLIFLRGRAFNAAECTVKVKISTKKLSVICAPFPPVWSWFTCREDVNCFSFGACWPNKRAFICSSCFSTGCSLSQWRGMWGVNLNNVPGWCVCARLLSSHVNTMCPTCVFKSCARRNPQIKCLQAPRMNAVQETGFFCFGALGARVT